MIDGKRLRQLRETHGYTRQKLAEAVGMGTAQLERYEYGTSDATGETLARLATLFGVSADYLLGLTDNPAPNIDATLRPEEVALLAAWRRRDYREMMKVIVSQE